MWNHQSLPKRRELFNNRQGILTQNAWIEIREINLKEICLRVLFFSLLSCIYIQFSQTVSSLHTLGAKFNQKKFCLCVLFFLILSCIYVQFSQIVSSLHTLRAKFCVHHSNPLSVLHVWATSSTVPNFTTLNFIWKSEILTYFALHNISRKIGCYLKITGTARTFTRTGV